MDRRGIGRSRRGVRVMGGAAAAAASSRATTWDDSSESFDSRERSSSALPTLTGAMNNLSVETASALTRGTRSQSVRHVNHRQGLRSAVPDSAVLSPVDRPDTGGSKGREITVYTNHFSTDIGNAIVYQYEIDIAMIDRNQRSCLANKDDRWNVIQVFFKGRKGFPVVWYDEGRTLYTREMLPDVQLPVQIELKKEDETKRFQLNKLDLVGNNRITDINDFVQGKNNIRPREAIRIIEILFKQRGRNDFINVRNQFYHRNQKMEDLDDGRCMARGFYQALCLTQCGPTLNVNLTFTCFYMPLSFIDFASKYLRRDITTGLNGNDAKKFEKLIRNLRLETMHTGRRIFYRFREFGLPANQIMFTCNDDDSGAASTLASRDISVADYFDQRYRRRIRYPNLVCINATKGNDNRPNWLPMEVARVVEWQRALKPLDKQQRGSVSRSTIIKPAERYEQIMKIVGNNQYNRDPYLKELNINVNDKEMLKLKARVLQSPEIKYRRRGRGETVEHVRFGKWRVQNWFYDTPPINSWGMIYFGDRRNREIENNLEHFQNQLPELLERTGFVINTGPSLTMRNSRENDVRNALQEASEQGWQLAIIILNSSNSDDVYNLVKSYSNGQIGLMTQCVNYQALRRNIDKLNMYVDNISQKINAKLGGINGVVNVRSALSHSSKDDLFMFFGADVTHSTTSYNRPSIAAVVGSRDLTNTLYSSRVCEQYPRKGRCSVEIIKDLERMVAELLQVFARGCGNRLPNKIIFYRDGVDEGQYQKVLDNEVMKIKAACRSVYGNKPLPQLTFIVVKKRHNTRFFLYENNQTDNVLAGTVVDQGIVHPSQFDFYLCSQAALMGTSRPALYHVLHDDIGFNSDDIQQLTYWLCHTDMRCTKSVSIPAPVHYAHLAAYASRLLKYNEEHDTENLDDDNEEPENYSLDDIKTKLMVLDEKIADDMWFI